MFQYLKVNVAFFKKSNGYQPYLYNTSADFCNFLKQRQKYPILQVLANYMLHSTNINHTCPFDVSTVVSLGLGMYSSNSSHKKKRTRDFPIPIVMWGSILPKSSNFLRLYTCVFIYFQHDIIAENLVLNENIFKLLPLGNGEYMFRIMVGAYNDWKCEIKCFFSIF